MTTRHLDLGCGPCPRNPYRCDEVHAVDLALPDGVDAQRFRRANLSLEPIPHADASFDSVSAFDFLEHVPRVLGTADGRSTRFPFVELMDEIHRVLKPGGRFYALTPAYPNAEAFQDPTHVNIITEETWRYFCGATPMARPYGFKGTFEMLRNERAIYPEAFEPTVSIGWRRRHRRARLLRTGRLAHQMWEFSRAGPVA
ncbi:MAG: class I SAM-dependent methyltransferase [Burkholderiales bacterium]|nr:class I SAM-dependent methyltransferase [Burkholderiales bacterium]MDE2628429.1 class I SAM-dependent methyltransferase [Burkholderiales bacterium]